MISRMAHDHDYDCLACCDTGEVIDDLGRFIPCECMRDLDSEDLREDDVEWAHHYEYSNYPELQEYE